MSKRLSQDEIISIFRTVHGEAYGYDKVVYTGGAKKVEITCPVHGSFLQTPNNHRRGVGCPHCAAEAKRVSNITTEEFVRRASEVHEGSYDYGETVYVNSSTPVKIICPIHGVFEQTPSNHLSGSGCRKCGYEAASRKTRKTREEFIVQAQAIHGDRYSYNNVNYLGDSTKVEIVCPEHGSFWQTPNKHTSAAQGCPMCAPNRPLSRELFIDQARLVHGDRYDYSLVPGGRVSGHVTIVCRQHGKFTQLPHDHLDGHGCRACFDENRPKLSFGEYLATYGRDGWTYEGFSGYFEPLTITCPIHGTFVTTGDVHVNSPSGGCEGCRSVSSPQRIVAEMLKGENVIMNTRKVIAPLEVDIYLPDHAVGIEVNGLYWHRHEHLRDRLYHQNKFEAAEKVGVHLVQFWESEMRDSPELVKSYIDNLVGRTTRRIYARECEVVDLKFTQYNEFLKANHLEGGGITSGWRKGLVYQGELVAVMGFKGEVLQRFCSLLGTSVVGGFSKLLSKFPGSHVVTYSDNRYSDGALYKNAGFTMTRENPWRLMITDLKSVYSRQNYMKSRLTEWPGYDPDSTEEEILRKSGFFYIYAPGTRKWELHK